MTKDDLDNAIDMAHKEGLSAIAEKAFGYSLSVKNYVPRQKCLVSDYSSGEAVVCSILLAFYFEMNGTPDYLEVPQSRTWSNSITDLIWPGAYYFVAATNRLTDSGSWQAIKILLPLSKK